jgi:hypothetical protein
MCGVEKKISLVCIKDVANASMPVCSEGEKSVAMFYPTIREVFLLK